MTLLAGLNIAAYLGGYVVRLPIMTRVAKSRRPDVNRRYFHEETLVAAIALTAIPALLALIGTGSPSRELRAGFTTFFASPGLPSRAAHRALYGCLYLFGTWIYLDPRENTYCIPLNRCSSLLSGVVSSYGLHVLLGLKPPRDRTSSRGSPSSLALVIMMVATLRRRHPGRFTPAQRIFLFVCGGNTSRSPMAQAICNAEIVRRLGLELDNLAGGPALAMSAGITATPGRPLTQP